ncbi:MAG: hypothetical protein JST12_11525 [Armatimonadetes bacterium]|nr:hypothetical protein [Armatimonadota bacterium]
MSKVILLSLFAIALIGCKSGGGDTNTNNSTVTTPPPTTNSASTQTGAGGAGGVAPMTSGAAGGMTPMSGTDSVQGSGGGSVAMGAKGFAKRKLSEAGTSTVGQMPSDDSGQ